jgi:2-polyprenyl-3-methyl-5-hydroxy-6-metoxy-1,4-benzoquinol methylase
MAHFSFEVSVLWGEPIMQVSAIHTENALIRDSTTNEKTTKAYWEASHSQPRWRLPSRLNVGTSNILRLLGRKVEPGMKVLEIGCAPGKHLAYLAKKRQARVCGLDYSEPGIAFSKELFSRLRLAGEFRCENVFATEFPESSFDVVYSLGVIEHFDNPLPLIEKHLLLASVGGLVLLAVPNYAGIYGRFQRHFDPENLKIHNLDIMNRKTLTRLAPKGLACETVVYPSGRLSPWIIHFETKWPVPVAKGMSYALNALGLLQPFEIGPLCPMLVLSMRRRGDDKSEICAHF